MRSNTPPICGIGASAGGVEALQQFFESVPPDLGLAYVVVVHLAPDRKSELPGIIARRTKMPVIQVGDDDKTQLEPNHVYVIAPDRQLIVNDGSVGAAPFVQPRGHRMVIDLFFRSLADAHGDGFAVVLSGSGADGALGAKAIKAHGGLVLVQDPADATHGDMPRAVLAMGVADLVLPARELGARLGELAHNKTRMLLTHREELAPIASDEEHALRGVLDLVKKRTGHDFAQYKRSTMVRRLSRRMQLTGQLTLPDYLTHLRSHVSETESLFNDLLISVTTFFRDPTAWSALSSEVLGPLLERADPDDPLRLWVPGCSTGEEAYSLAIVMLEEIERRKIANNFIVFASDLDETVLATAREGVYPDAISADVSDARLERHFRRDDEHYRVLNVVRDHVVFAAHNLLRDPPFSRLHLISCRNLLIYLERDLQEQVMEVFRYALRDDGCLFLGAAEAADEELFHTIDKRHRIFVCRPRVEGVRAALPEILSAAGPRVPRIGRDGGVGRSSGSEMHLAAIEQLAPPSVVIDDRWNVVHVSPTAARFFQQSAGPPARRVVDLVRPDLREELHTLITRAADQSTPQLSPFVAVTFNGTPHQVAILANPRLQDPQRGSHFLITFLDGGPIPADAAQPPHDPPDETVRDLRQKLRHAEQRVETMRDEHYAIHEDLRAANEELQSLNEEYRSTTEELETSKEELQSINEELQTVNHELKAKLEEISRAHSDLENLMEATDVATLFLDRELRITRFTPRLSEIFKVRTRDFDRPIGDLKHSLDYDTLEQDARRVLTQAVTIERETGGRDGRMYVARITPYRLSGGRDVDGVVITFVDLTSIKQAEAAIRASETRLAAELDTMLDRMTAPVSNTQEALEQILATAIEAERADFGHVQLLGNPGHLRIVAQRGCDERFLETFATMPIDSSTSYGRVLRERQTVHITDVLDDPASTPFRPVALEIGYRSVTSIPLFGRLGDPIGVLSVHYREPRAYSERDHQISGLFGRQAGYVIESRMHHDRVHRLNEELRQRTEELEASQRRLSRQAADLTEQDRNRDEFLAALGHELRNPMSAIHNSLAIIRVADEDSARALAILRRQDQHMLRLVNDLLDITRVKHGRIRLERLAVDANEVARAVFDTARAQAEQKGLHIEYVPPSMMMYVDADPERLTQILDNLLRNAITYTDRGSISLRVVAEGGVARFTVRDTGVGIESHEIPRIFHAYQQRAIGHRSGGLGLGLALVQALVDAHGGTVSVESAGRGQGSEFSFTVPLASAPSSTTERSSVAPRPARRRVLVVDDQHDVADALGALLRTLGQEVEVVYDGTDALAAATKRPPQVAFIDQSMPEMSGVELARELRKKFPALPLVAVTGNSKVHTGPEASEFTHSLLKPATEEMLATLLHALPLADERKGARRKSSDPIDAQP